MSSSKKSSPPAKGSGPEAPAATAVARPDAAPPPEPPRESPRDTIESVVGAFLLAFLFRTFQAEAFVIPTGSMAPTLYGEQRDVCCEKCGTRFAVGADSLPSPQAELRYDQAPARPSFVGRLFPQATIDPNQRLHSVICPNSGCQYVNSVLDRQIFAGDRILVNKFPYEFTDPQRWDVVVFRFPEKPKTNYIKRLVGLPGEQIRVIRGDVWYRAAGSDDAWKIARKSPERQVKIQLPVHDNDRPARDLLAAGWPESWAAEAGAAEAGAAEAASGEPGAGKPGAGKAGANWQAD
ncbi:MAG: signal peptidase I, partial [Planctomycetaceae bacterium]